MCGRSTFATVDEIRSHIPDLIVAEDITIPSGLFTPGETVPVLARKDGHPILGAMRWGFEDGFAYNARSETVSKKPFWAPMRSNHCILVLNSFVEGDCTFEPTADEGIFYAKALWGHARDGKLSVSMLTTVANEVVAKHHRRMPVLTPDPFPWIGLELHEAA